MICPGPTEGTGLMQDSIDAGAQDAEFLKNYIIPMKKMGTTKDIGGCCGIFVFRYGGTYHGNGHAGVRWHANVKVKNLAFHR